MHQVGPSSCASANPATCIAATNGAIGTSSIPASAQSQQTHLDFDSAGIHANNKQCHSGHHHHQGIVAMNPRHPQPPHAPPRQQQPQPHEEAEAEAEAPFELQPRFTEQDEARELATLTIQDLLKLQSDLTGLEGITAGVSGMGFGGNAPNHGTGAGGASSSAVAAGSTSNGGVAAGNNYNSVLQNVYRLPSAGCDSHADDNGDLLLHQLSDQDRMRVAALDQQMSALPQSQTEVYHLAKLRCPAEVSPRRKLQFLDCEDNDVAAAAKRLARYWDLRLDLFGDEACFLPMTLGGAMKGEVMNMARQKVFQLLPHTDGAGRGIVYECWGRRDLSRYTTRQEFRALFYLLHVLMQDDSIRRRGYIILVNGSQTSGRQFSRQFPKYLQWTEAALPIRVRAAHICNASPVMHCLILPTVKRFLPRDMRLRAKLHRGSNEVVLRCLAEYNIMADRVPVDLGGTVGVDASQFLIDRISLEAASAGIRLSSSTSSSSRSRSSSYSAVSHAATAAMVGTSGGGTMAAAPATAAAAHLTSSSAAGAAAAGAAAGISTCAVGPTKRPKRTQASQSSKKGRPRNVTDPRVVRAVRAKRDDPDMSLNDALLVGGFRFDLVPGKKDNEIVDDEGISLKQRKNNLLRRLRIEKQKEEERQKLGLPAVGTSSDGGALTNGSIQADGKPSAADPSANGGGSNGSPSHERRDSFDEEIFNLPGLDNLDDDILDDFDL